MKGMETFNSVRANVPIRLGPGGGGDEVVITSCTLTDPAVVTPGESVDLSVDILNGASEDVELEITFSVGSILLVTAKELQVAANSSRTVKLRKKIGNRIVENLGFGEFSVEAEITNVETV